MQGAQQRVTGATKLNQSSSRSHAVFIIIVENSASCFDQGCSTANGTVTQAIADMAPGQLAVFPPSLSLFSFLLSSSQSVFLSSDTLLHRHHNILR